MFLIKKKKPSILFTIFPKFIKQKKKKKNFFFYQFPL